MQRLPHYLSEWSATDFAWLAQIGNKIQMSGKLIDKKSQNNEYDI